MKSFFARYYDERGYFQHVVRWGANDGPDDAFENTAGWPELHALGASDEILQLHLRAWEGMLRQFTEAKTTDVPIGRQGMYYRDFSVQSDWMHHGEALRTFNVLALSVPTLPAYQRRARTYAALYMGEEPGAPNYDPRHKIIKSMIKSTGTPSIRRCGGQWLVWVADHTLECRGPEMWYWSMKPEDRLRIGRDAWIDYLEGRNPDFPETVLKRDLESIPRRIAAMQKNVTSPDTRLADNAMEFNPAAVAGMVQLMWGALVPGREGSLLSARLRYFDPVRRRAGVPDDVAALVSELTDDRTVVTL